MREDSSEAPSPAEDAPPADAPNGEAPPPAANGDAAPANPDGSTGDEVKLYVGNLDYGKF